MGVISAIGNSVTENRQALIAGKSGVSHIELFDTRYAAMMPFGEIKISNNLLKEKLSAGEPALTRTTLLALHAFNEAIADAALDQHQLQSSGTALIGASTVGGMCLSDELYNDAHKTE